MPPWDTWCKPGKNQTSTAQCGFEVLLGLENVHLPLSDTNHIMSDNLNLNKNASSSLFKMWHCLSGVYAKSVKKVQRWGFDATLVDFGCSKSLCVSKFEVKSWKKLKILFLIKENKLRNIYVLESVCTMGHECCGLKGSHPYALNWTTLNLSIGARGCDSHIVFKGFHILVKNVVLWKAMFGYSMYQSRRGWINYYQTKIKIWRYPKFSKVMWKLMMDAWYVSCPMLTLLSVQLLQHWKPLLVRQTPL